MKIIRRLKDSPNNYLVGEWIPKREIVDGNVVTNGMELLVYGIFFVDQLLDFFDIPIDIEPGEEIEFKLEVKLCA